MQTNRRSFFQQLVQPGRQVQAPVQIEPNRFSQNVDPIQHLLKRATFGVTPKLLAHAQAIGAEAWIDEQLNPDQLNDELLEREMMIQPMWSMTRRELYDTYYDYDVAVGMRKGIFTQAIYSEKQLLERVIDFWRDHFNISDESDYPIELMMFEQNVLRQHAFGSFRDLLIATAKSPSMLVYLDNYVSYKEAPNENYARELLELHTLGVDGDYTEEDIREVARALTGWTIHTGTDDGFFFDAEMHDREAKKIFGKNFPAGRGISDGLHLLSLLAMHPDTARFIVTKLCRRFVSDQPPQSLIESGVRVWVNSDGDIKTVLKHILLSAEFKQSTGQKYMRPFEYIVAMFRATNNSYTSWWTIEEMLIQLGQYPHGWHPPNGYPDVAGAWINSGGLLNRWNSAMFLTHGAFENSEDGWGIVSRLAEHIDSPQTAADLVDQIATRLWGAPLLNGPAKDQFIDYVSDGEGADAPMTRHLLSRKLASTFGLMMASPYFQWR